MKLKSMPLAELEERAKTATNIAMQSRPHIPASVPITIGTLWDDPCVVFELYVAQDRPRDAIILTRARINMYDGRIEAMNVFDDAVNRVIAEAE